MKTIIYYLHYGDAIPFYVGKTKNSISKREREHRNKLKNKNIVLETIDEIPTNEWKFWEKHYISLFKSWGFKLENKNNGGGGSTSRTEEFKINLSKQKKGKELKNAQKILLQFDLEGNFIKEWESYSQAFRILKNQGISKVARGEHLKAENSIWCYKKEYTPELIKNKVFKLKNSTIPIIQFDLNMNKISEFTSIQEAAKHVNKQSAAICECCQGKRKTAYNFIWKYKK